ncbi:hypothetical protein GGI16_000854 [Coemansia sp. S142-1]|nr:hypothetical protein GGI16_000854 [Coemansia sp. S142-1]
MSTGKPAQVDPAANDLQPAQLALLASPEHACHTTAPVPASLAHVTTRIDDCCTEPSVLPSASAAVTISVAALLRDQSGGSAPAAAPPGQQAVLLNHHQALLQCSQRSQAARSVHICQEAAASSAFPSPSHRRRLLLQSPLPALSLSALPPAMPPPPSLLSVAPSSSISSSSPLHDHHHISTCGITEAAHNFPHLSYQNRLSHRLSSSSQHPTFYSAYSLHPSAASVLGHSRQHNAASPAVAPNYVHVNSRGPYNYQHYGYHRTRNRSPGAQFAYSQLPSASRAPAAAYAICGQSLGVEMSVSSGTTTSITSNPTTNGAVPAVYSPYAHPGHSGYLTATISASSGTGVAIPVSHSASYLTTSAASSSGADIGSLMSATAVTSAPTATSTAASSESPQAAPSSSSSAAAATAAAALAAAASRVNQACASCRRKKVRCDGVQPSCGNCVNRSMSCTYLAQKKRGRPPKVQARQSSMPYYAPPSIATSSGAPATSMSASALATSVSGLSSAQISTAHQASPGVMPGFGTSQGSTLSISIADSLSQPPATAPAYFGNWHSSADVTTSTGIDAQAVLTSARVSTPGASVGYYQQPLAYSGADHRMSLFVSASSGRDGPLLQTQPQQQRQSSALSFHLTTTGADGALRTTPTVEPSQALPSPGLHHPAYKFHASVPSVQPSPFPASVGLALQGTQFAFASASEQTALSSARLIDLGSINQQAGLFSGYMGSATTNAPSSDYFGAFPASARSGVDDMDIHNLSFPLNSAGIHSLTSDHGTHLTDFNSLGLASDQASGSNIGMRRPHAAESDALSFSLDNVAMAMAQPDADANTVQSSLDHLLYVTKSITSSGYEAPAFRVKDEVPAKTVGRPEAAGTEYDNSRIHDTLVQLERRRELAGRALHGYFSYIHHQCPIIHRPTFLRLVADGTVNHFVWFALRALAARTLLHSHIASSAEVVAEEEYFASKAHVALSSELSRPSIEVVQGLALLSLYIFGTARWQEASMYWCKATRLAQLLECHVIDAPTRAIATKMHFGIFEPPKRGTTHRDDLALIPGDFSGQHVPLAQALTPLEAELRRRLWWILFTNERFCAIAERLPTMVNEARMFVHFPCSASEWDRAEFEYQAPARVPRYLREGCARAGPPGPPGLALGPEMTRRKADNLYLMSEIEYGFAMSHLVAFLADMGALFRPSSPYGNDYVPMFSQMAWPARMAALRANVERVERIFEGVRQDILRRLAAPPNNTWAPHATSATGAAQSHHPTIDTPTAVEIPHLHQLAMLILYSVLNIHLYRMVFQIHYELSSSLPAVSDGRCQDDIDLMTAFDQYVKDLWLRTTTAAQVVSRILRGEHQGVPHWVLSLAGISRPMAMDVDAEGTPSAPTSTTATTSAPTSSTATAPDGARRLRSVFQDRIRAQEARLHDVAISVFASFRRTLPYALLLAAKVHVDNIEWWADEHHDENMSQAYLDLAEIARFLETHQLAFSSTNYVSLVKGMMRVDIN